MNIGELLFTTVRKMGHIYVFSSNTLQDMRHSLPVTSFIADLVCINQKWVDHLEDVLGAYETKIGPLSVSK